MASAQKNDWFLGVDLGTGSCKAVIVDATARVLGFGVSAYPAAESPTAWKEPDPEALLDGMIRSTRQAIEQADVSAGRCRAMSVGSALHSLIAIGRSGKPLTGVLTWVDNRADRQAAAVRDTKAARRLYQQTGCPAHSLYPLYKIIWLREARSDVFEKTARFVSAKDYLINRLTGQWLTDVGIASGSGLLNVYDLNWDPEALALAGIDSGRLAGLASPWHLLSGINPKIASQMGIPAGTPLVMGSSDAVNSSLGAGAVDSNCATCMVGTSGAFRIISPEALLDASERSWCYAIDESHWLMGGAVNNGGIVLSWFKDALNQAFLAESESGKITFDDLIRRADIVGPGAGGLISLPFLVGERSPNWNMNARGVFFGLTLQHDTGHMARALLEGVAYRLRSVAEVLDDMGCEIREIRASGGLVRSKVWPRIMADVFGLELKIPDWGETSSMGAALWAMLGTGVIGSIDDIKDLIPLKRSFTPVEENVQCYDELYGMYKDLYTAVRPSFDRIARFQKKS